jgi:DHA2 family multidrug resistance protein
LVGRVIGRVDARWLLVGGFTVLAIAMYRFGGINTQIAMSNVAWPNIVMGLSLGFIFVPLTTQTMGTLENWQMGNATGIYNLMRNLGGGVGISAVTTMLARGQQAHQAMMVGHVTPYDPAVQERVGAIVGALAPRVGEVAAKQAAYGIVYQEVQRQAGLWAYVDDFRVMAVMCVACVPLVFLFRKVVHKGKVEVGAH